MISISLLKHWKKSRGIPTSFEDVEVTFLTLLHTRLNISKLKSLNIWRPNVSQQPISPGSAYFEAHKWWNIWPGDFLHIWNPVSTLYYNDDGELYFFSACHLWNKKKKTKVRRRRKSHVVKELRQWPCRDDLRLAKIHRQIASDFNFALYNFHTGSSWVLFSHFFMSFFQRWNVITELTIADFTWQSVSSGIY